MLNEQQTILDRIASKTAEMEAAFAAVEVVEPSVYVEIQAAEEDNTGRKRVFFMVADSNSETALTTMRGHLERYPVSAEEAYTRWEAKIDQWLKDCPVKNKLLWRKRPLLEWDKDFETNIKRWNVYSRFAAI